jgi:hypothetical protein
MLHGPVKVEQFMEVGHIGFEWSLALVQSDLKGMVLRGFMMGGGAGSQGIHDENWGICYRLY